MSRFTTKQELVDDVAKERRLLSELLSQIPDDQKLVEVTDGMSVKDFLAHRAEWGRMVIDWYTEAKQGGTPAVPSERFKWNQLKELNAGIQDRFSDAELAEVEQGFVDVQDRLDEMLDGITEEELLENKHYAFTGKSDLATYVNASTASHYRSARRLIGKWWRQQNE